MLATPRRKLVASQLVIAVNAQAARLSSSGLASRIIPVASHIVVTEPLPEATAQALLPNMRTGAVLNLSLRDRGIRESRCHVEDVKGHGIC